jgi:hypothetical protein
MGRPAVHPHCRNSAVSTHVHAKRVVELRDGSPPGWSLPSPCWGHEWKNVLDAQCQMGSLGEFLVATNWLVLQLGRRSTCMQNGRSKFAMDHLLAGPCFWHEWKNVLDAQCQTGGLLGRISDRDELASAAVRGAKHEHAKRVVEIRDG